MAVRTLNDKVLVNEFCNIGEDNCDRPKYLQVCYSDNYKCPHWEQEFKLLYQAQEQKIKEVKENEQTI